MSLRETFDQAWDEVTARATCVVQEKEELFALAALMQAEGVRSYLELGASEGVSLYVLGMCLQYGYLPSVRVTAVDICEEHSYPHLVKNLEELQTAGVVAFAMKDTTENARPRFGNDPYDAVMIDAGHTYEEAKADWEMYGQMGKMVIFHDIRHPGVSRLWQELKGKYAGTEIHTTRVTVHGGELMGFGVIYNA